MNIDNVTAYYHTGDNEAYVLLVLDLLMGDELTAEQYNALYMNIREVFFRKGYMHPEIMTIIVTGYPEKVKDLVGISANYWIIAVQINRLMIFENQPNDFLGLRDRIENNLTNNEQSMRSRLKAGSSKYFSLCTIILLLLNCMVFLYTETKGSTSDADFLYNNGALSWTGIVYNRQYYRLLTGMFLHAGLDHLFNNMLTLIFLGSILERVVGKIRFLIIYLISGIGAGIVSVVYDYISFNKLNTFDKAIYAETVSVGASGAIFGIIAAVLYIVIRNKGHLANLGKTRLIIYIVLSLYSGFVTEGINNAAHIGGLIIGFLLAVILYRKKRISGLR